MSSLVMTETVAATSSSGRRVRVAAVVTASSWVGTACGVGLGAGVAAAGGTAGGVWADSGTAIVQPSAVVASRTSGRGWIFICQKVPKKKRTPGWQWVPGTGWLGSSTGEGWLPGVRAYLVRISLFEAVIRRR